MFQSIEMFKNVFSKSYEHFNWLKSDFNLLEQFTLHYKPI